MEKGKFAGRLTFGILLISMGVTFFLNTAGIVDWGVWSELWRFWPVLLIVAGINTIFEKSPAWPVAYISPLLVIAVFWFVITGYKSAGEGGNSPFFAAFGNRSELFSTNMTVSGYEPGEVESIDFTFNGGAGTFGVKDLSGGKEGEIAIIEAKTYGSPAALEEKLVDGKLMLELTESSVDKLRGSKGGSFDIRVSPEFLYSFEFNCGAADATLNFSELQVNDAEINCGAASVDVIVPASGSKPSRLEINTGASSIKIGVPRGVKLSIEQNGLGSVNSENVESAGKGEYINKDWHGWANHEVRVELNSAVSEIKIYGYESDVESDGDTDENETNGEAKNESAQILEVSPVAA